MAPSVPQIETRPPAAASSDGALAALPTTPPAGPVEPEDVALDALLLPTRMANWADRHGVTTLRELARIAPATLLREPPEPAQPDEGAVVDTPGDTLPSGRPEERSGRSMDPGREAFLGGAHASR